MGHHKTLLERKEEFYQEVTKKAFIRPTPDYPELSVAQRKYNEFAERQLKTLREVLGLPLLSGTIRNAKPDTLGQSSCKRAFVEEERRIRARILSAI